MDLTSRVYHRLPVDDIVLAQVSVTPVMAMGKGRRMLTYGYDDGGSVTDMGPRGFTVGRPIPG